jgi:hypothetical protein
MLYQILCVIIIALFIKIVYNTLYKSCDAANLVISYPKINAKILNEFDELAEINMDTNIPCGIYSCTTEYGKTYIINNKKSYIYNIFPYNITKTNPTLFISSVIRLNDKANDIINTFNRGCCIP